MRPRLTTGLPLLTGAEPTASICCTVRAAGPLGKCLGAATPEFGDSCATPAAGRQRAGTYGTLRLTTDDILLSAPVVVYATPPKYQVPAERLPSV